MAKKKEGLSLVDLFTLGFGAIIGVGWSVTLNNVMITGGGPVPAALGFALATVAFIPVALCYAELTPAMPVAGGIIVYAYRAFNTGTSFMAGWFLVMSYISILPWEAIAINDVISYIVPQLRSGTVLYTIAGTDIYLRTVIVGLALSMMVVALNWRGVQSAAAFQTVLTLFLIVSSIACAVFALIRADASHVLPIYAPMEGKTHTSFLTGVLSMFAMAPFYFSGFDTIPQGAEEAGGVKPSSLGRVIMGALVSAGLFYILIVTSAGLAYPWESFVGFDRPALPNLFRFAYPSTFGLFLFWLCLAATLAGLFTTWNGFYIAGARLLLGMGRARLLPRFFARIHPKYKTPYGGNLFCAMAMFTGPFLGIGIIDPLTVFASAGFVIGWGLCCLSAFRLRATCPDMPRPYRIPCGVPVALTGVAFCVFLFLDCALPGMPGYMGKGGLLIFLAWSLLGLIFYFGTRKYRLGISEEDRMAYLFESMKKPEISR